MGGEPAPHAGLAFSRAGHDGIGAEPLGGGENDVRPPDVLLRPVAIADDGLECQAVGSGNVDGDVLAHGTQNHRSRPIAMANGTHVSDGIH